jgi:hypothetical protein
MQPNHASIPLLIGQSSQRGWLRASLLTGALMLATVLSSAALPLLPGGSVALPGSPGKPATSVRDDLIPFHIRNGTGQLLLSGNVQDRVSRV